MEQLHASAVWWEGAGVLLRGPSGSGKSDLALRLIDSGAALVADDVVLIRSGPSGLSAEPPPALAGLLEVRGLGVFRLPWRTASAIHLMVELGAPDLMPERLPPRVAGTLLGVRVPLLHINAFHASTPARIRLSLRQQPELP